MPLLTTTDLQAYSDLAVAFFMDDTCNILRKPTTPDGNGGVSNSWSAINADPIPCAVVDSGGAMQQLLENAQFGKVQKVVILPRETDVKDNDRIQTLSNNLYYKVITANDPQSYEVVRRATVQRFGSGVNL